VLVWFCITLTTFRAKITTMYLCLSKLCLNTIGSVFSGHGVYPAAQFNGHSQYATESIGPIVKS